MEEQREGLLQIELGYDKPQVMAELFEEYTNMLVENDPDFAAYLAIQRYDEEVADLVWKYGLPDGRLYLVICADQPAACVALRKLDERSCELKRLYVRPAFRGRGIGARLLDMIIEEARAIGYERMLLDTLPFLTRALAMYERRGFREVGRYNDSPLGDCIYLELDLRQCACTCS